MRTDKVKQIICIAEADPAAFQDKMNEALVHLNDPEIVFDPNRSFTCCVIYTVRRDMPENVLELFEMVDGEQHKCCDCPNFIKPDDKRRKWGTCSHKAEPVRFESSACEAFYLLRYKMLAEAKEKLLEQPFKVDR